MLIVQDCIISEDIADQCFCCDLSKCKGQCCVEGDCGAPLLESEIPILEHILPVVEPYMTEEGLEVVHRDGVSALDNAAEPCTPLVNNRECAYVAWGDDGTAFCAIESPSAATSTLSVLTSMGNSSPSITIAGTFAAVPWPKAGNVACPCTNTYANP